MIKARDFELLCEMSYLESIAVGKPINVIIKMYWNVLNSFKMQADSFLAELVSQTLKQVTLSCTAKCLTKNVLLLVNP